jgi:hypothetical protein
MMVATTLEDPSGNSVAAPFEVDMTGAVTRELPRETVALPFQIR